MGTYIIRDVQNFLIERWGRKQMDHEPTLDDVYSSEITRLREQNRVLDGALRLVLESWVNGRKVRDWPGSDCNRESRPHHHEPGGAA